MNNNLAKIFSEKEIYLDNLNLNMDKNLPFEDINVKNPFDTFDNIFNNKSCRISSCDENEYSKNQLKHNLTPVGNNKTFFNIIENNNELNINKQINANLKEFTNKKRKNEVIKDYKIIDNIAGKKVLFNSYKLNQITEEQKEKQKIKNKVSARKSRLKKKQYISQLEKEYLSVKNQLDEIKHGLGINNNNDNNNKNIMSLIENENICSHKKEINCENCEKIEVLKSKENSIINQNIENLYVINSYTELQKNILEKLLINQLLIMMPINIKIFQNKYLKLNTFNEEENLIDIKNKINKNLKAIEELYGIKNLKEGENGIKVETNYFINKNSSMAQQIYNYYYNIKNFVNEFEKIYSSLL